MRLAVFVAPIVALVAAIPPAASADCAYIGLSAKVITPADTVVPGDGGIVVVAVNDPHATLDPGDPAVRSGWRLRVGGDTLKPLVEVLAPGLAIYRVAVANTFKAELVGDKGLVVANVKSSRTTGGAPPAPEIKRAWFERTGNRHCGEHVGIELAGALPAHVVALVLADGKGVAKSWTTIADATAAEIFPYNAHDCAALPNGTRPSKSGDTVTAFWVDDAGRRSPISKSFVVK